MQQHVQLSHAASDWQLEALHALGMRSATQPCSQLLQCCGIGRCCTGRAFGPTASPPPLLVLSASSPPRQLPLQSPQAHFSLSRWCIQCMSHTM